MGLLHLVEFLQLGEKVRANPTMVKLVFVVPGAVEAKFKSQMIVTEEIFKQTGAILPGRDCDQIPGIGPSKKRKLNDRGLNTVQDVLAAPAEAITFVKMTVETFQKNMVLVQDAALWSGVEQYVVGLDSKPSASLDY